MTVYVESLFLETLPNLVVEAPFDWEIALTPCILAVMTLSVPPVTVCAPDPGAMPSLSLMVRDDVCNSVSLVGCADALRSL